jgi:hypothetical protein
MQEKTTVAERASWQAVATLCNALMTGLVLGLVSRRGAKVAAEYVFRHFRRQQEERFLPGLAKLGLSGEPHVVACALYHFHSNALGGVKTEYFRESDRKAWVRYPPPRWIWRGTAAAGIPHEVSAAMLHGWHGNNGVALGNPRLGFVCTGMTVDGMPGLEGYYFVGDHDLAPGDRVRFAYGEESMPRAMSMPALDPAQWPEERLLRTQRGYAVEYVRTMFRALPDATGSFDELARVARVVGLQFHESLADELGFPSNLSEGSARSAELFAKWLETMLAGHGEDVVREGTTLRIESWKLGKGIEQAGAAFKAWNELWVGSCMAHDRFLKLIASCGPAAIEWKLEAKSTG